MKTRTRNLLLGALAGFVAIGAATESPGCTDSRITAADGMVDRAENLADGLNEKGLSFGWLSMPDYTTYQDQAAAREPEKSIAHLDLCPWVLGNFATVDEVKAAFAGVHVWGKPIGPVNLIFPLHASVHDASGRSIVLEFTKEGPKVYDNLPGVLTNAPTFDWHLINVRNFLNLKAMSAGPIRVGASVLSPRRKLGEE